VSQTGPLLQISVCTYRRPHMLGACLASLAQLDFPIGVSTGVLVVDNSSERTAEPIVAGQQQSFPVPLRYECEPRRGISMARNRALDLARRNGADYLVFIDDDEHADRNWLASLYGFAVASGPDHIIHGDVRAELPPGTPSHIAHCFQAPQLSTGTILRTCATNNVIIPMGLVKKHDLWFDERYALTGGEDTAFLLAASRAGAIIRQCREAVVYETIPESRATLRWLSRRRYRNGIQSLAFDNPGRRASSAPRKLLSRLWRSGIALLRGRRRDAVDLWLKACVSAGMCSGMVGLRFNEYRQNHGD
jgi:succinoglycan biosynthesis protein ExoM